MFDTLSMISAPPAPHPPTEGAIESAVERELLMVSLRAGRRTPFTAMLAAMLIALIVSYDPGSGGLRLTAATAAWLLLIGATLMANWRYAGRVSRAGAKAMNLARVSWTYGLCGTLTAVTWASALFVLPRPEPLTDTVLIAAITMVLCGGTVSTATHGLGVRLYAYPLAILAAVALAWRGEAAYISLGVGFLLLAYHMDALTRNFERLTAERLQLSIVNERLTQKANAERSAAELARSQAESLRLQADEARDAAVRADRAKTSFIAATSHDLRQPLHALVQHVADLHSRPMPAELIPCVVRIDHAVTVMADLMDAVLDLSQVAAGELLPDLRAMSLRRLLAGVENQAFPEAQAKGLSLRLRVDDGWVMSDEALLIRVIGNIVHNALRYTQQGEVVVRARRLRNRCRVTVADTGIGIAREAQPRIFDEYFQHHNPGRDRRKGLGLGLSIVRELSQRLDLRIRFRSTVGRGTVFTIDIPEAELLPTVDDSVDAQANDYVKGALILLIDDDPMAREGMAATLQRIGCRVLPAANADEAQGLIDDCEFSPQVVLSDLRLAEGIDGAQLAAALSQRLQRRFGGEFLPAVVIVTGDTQLESERAKLTLAASVLKKPVAPNTLYAALNAALKSMASREGR